MSEINEYKAASGAVKKYILSEVRKVKLTDCGCWVEYEKDGPGEYRISTYEFDCRNHDKANALNMVNRLFMEATGFKPDGFDIGDVMNEEDTRQSLHPVKEPE